MLTIIVFIAILIYLPWNVTGCFMRRSSVSSTGKPEVAVKVRGAAFSLSSSSANPIIADLSHTLMMVCANSSSSKIHLKISFNYTISCSLLFENLRRSLIPGCSNLGTLIYKCISSPIPICNLTLSTTLARVSCYSLSWALSIVQIACLVCRLLLC